jgi:general secretion pathway protein G
MSYSATMVLAGLVPLQSCDPLRDANEIRILAAGAQLKAFAAAIKMYEKDTGHSLDGRTGLMPIAAGETLVGRRHGPYLPRIPLDPWGLEYFYADRPEPTVICYGADGKPGGSGADSDIVLFVRR